MTLLRDRNGNVMDPETIDERLAAKFSGAFVPRRMLTEAEVCVVRNLFNDTSLDDVMYVADTGALVFTDDLVFLPRNTPPHFTLAANIAYVISNAWEHADIEFSCDEAKASNGPFTQRFGTRHGNVVVLDCPSIARSGVELPYTKVIPVRT